MLLAALAGGGCGPTERYVRGYSVDPRSGVVVDWGLDHDMFPPAWRASPVEARATPVAPGDQVRSLSACRRALDKYPPELLRRSLERVYVVRSLAFSGIQAGGTNSRDRLYLANEGVSKGYTDDYLELAFHHELSSILLRNHAPLLDRAAWDAALPGGFAYRSDGTTAVREGRDATHLDPTLFARGFLSEYSTSSIEEDFNVFVERLFTGDEVFWEAVERHARLRAKCDVVIAFYARLDPAFDRAFFEGLR